MNKIPPKIFLKNNKSAESNSDFVSDSIGELLESGCVVQVPFKPFVVSPLSVAENREKKRLILDLSVLNNYIKKEKIKFEDYKTALQYFNKNCFLVKFDLKSGYHHIDISKECQTFLGFQWKEKYYCFTVLPFGLSSAPFVFTKCLRSMVRYWRACNIRIVLYLDDGLVMAQTFEECQSISDFIQKSLEQAGLFINHKKSVFSPVQEIEWLGIIWNSIEFNISIPERRIKDVEETLSRFIDMLPHVSARCLAKVAGKIMSLHSVLGNICRLMTRFSYMEIVLRKSWDSRLNLKFQEKTIRELRFWLQNVRNYNIRKLADTGPECIIVYSDASNVAAAACTVGVDESKFHLMWNEQEAQKSSTWREMRAIEQALFSFKNNLSCKSVKWFTDNQNCVKIFESGSMKLELQKLALSIFEFCKRHNISVNIQWIPREDNEKADYLSKLIDYDDWGVSVDFFQFIDSKWGPHTVDRFANANNKKLQRFNSVFWNPGTEAVNCFTQDWRNENNWLVPPVSLVIKTIKYVINCNAKGTLIVPKWVSASYWPYVFKDNLKTFVYVSDVLEFEDSTKIFIQGMNKNSIFGSERFYSSVLAIRLDATKM